MLARGTATEVPARNQNARAFKARLMQNELRIFLPVSTKPPVVKQKLPKSRLLDALQKLLRNNLIRIDINSIERRNPPAMHGKWFHFVFPISSRYFADNAAYS